MGVSRPAVLPVLYPKEKPKKLGTINRALSAAMSDADRLQATLASLLSDLRNCGIASVRLRLTGSHWNPLMLQNYAEACGIELMGIKRFEEHYERLRKEKEPTKEPTP